jgi:hypothetical protein
MWHEAVGAVGADHVARLDDDRLVGRRPAPLVDVPAPSLQLNGIGELGDRLDLPAEPEVHPGRRTGVPV